MGGELKPPQSSASRHDGSYPWLLLKPLPRVFRSASSEWVSDNAPRLGAAVAFYPCCRWPPSLLCATFLILSMVIALLFATLYKILPDVRLKWSNVALGAIITSLLLMLGKELMALYFAHVRFGSTYSAAGSPVVVLLWVYYSAQLFLWGAEFSKVYIETVGAESIRQP